MIPNSTPRFAHEPRTEQEVVCLFGALLHHLDVPLIIDQVRTPFPDCLARNAETGKPIRIEFELYGSHFIQHRHPVNDCDMVVCWIDNWGHWPATLRVIELNTVVRTKCPSLIEHIGERPVTWGEDSFMRACRINELSEAHLEAIVSIIEFARSLKLGPEWLTDATGSFAVRDHKQFFKVYANGRLALKFAGLDAGDLFPSLARDLNGALGKPLIAETDSRRKRIGGDVAELFSTAEQLEKFLAVWEAFANQRK